MKSPKGVSLRHSLAQGLISHNTQSAAQEGKQDEWNIERRKEEGECREREEFIELDAAV